MGAEFLACSEVAKQYQAKLASAEFSNLALVTILTSEDYWSEKYQTLISKDCKRAGIRHTAYKADSDGPLEKRIAECNANPEVQGVLLFYPLGPDITTNRYALANSIDPSKDVEGLNCFNVGRLVQQYNEASIIPATAEAVVSVLKHQHYPFIGTAMILNRSDVVGKPLRIVLEHLGMTVLAAYDETDPEVIDQMLSHSDLVITGVPDPEYRLSSNYVKEGSTVIAVNPTNIDEEALAERCAFITSRKQPIGRVTRKITLANLLKISKSEP